MVREWIQRQQSAHARFYPRPLHRLNPSLRLGSCDSHPPQFDSKVRTVRCIHRLVFRWRIHCRRLLPPWHCQR